MADDFTVNHIERLARAILAQLAPLTGTRGTGVMEVRATGTPGEHRIPANTYLIPIVGRQLRHDLPFKVLPNPGSSDGSWDCDPSDFANVGITSNVGGARHNLPSETVLRFDPPLSAFQPTATIVGDIADASSANALARSVAFYEDLDTADPAKDLFDAMVELPGFLLVWTGSEPAEGITTGLSQGATRQGRGMRLMRENFTLYVIAGTLGGESNRRQEGLTLMQAATRLLSDKSQNRDKEQLSTAGGVDVNQRERVDRGQSALVYALRLRMVQTLTAYDDRTFNEWITSRFRVRLPAGIDPDPTPPLTLVDDTEPMP